MAKYYLGSVGKAEAFRVNADGSRELAFVSKTLTDSGLNISTTKDDIRGGQGAGIQFSFYHDPSVEITLTDIVWKAEYLEAQLGARFVAGNDDYLTKDIEFTEGEATAPADIQPMQFACGESYLAWGAKKGSDEWKTISYENGKLKLDGASGTYCVRYLGISDGVKTAEISSVIIPEELFLLITAPIFAGDSCAASRGQTAGHISFEVPRFQLNGAQEFSMNMSSNQTMSLAGIALASESADCESVGGKLLTIREFINDRSWLDEIVALVSDEESQVKGATPVIYGVMKGQKPYKIPNTNLDFTGSDLDSNGKYQTGTYTISLKDKDVPSIQVVIA